MLGPDRCDEQPHSGDPWMQDPVEVKPSDFVWRKPRSARMCPCDRGLPQGSPACAKDFTYTFVRWSRSRAIGFERQLGASFVDGPSSLHRADLGSKPLLLRGPARRYSAAAGCETQGASTTGATPGEEDQFRVADRLRIGG